MPSNVPLAPRMSCRKAAPRSLRQLARLGRLLALLPLMGGLCALLACGAPAPEDKPGAGLESSQHALVTPFRRNVALGKPATQSSLLDWQFPAANAVDGRIGQFYPWPSPWGPQPIIASTLPQSNPWWQVDLQDVLFINEIVLYSRVDCCVDRLKPYEVRYSVDGVNWTLLYASSTAPPYPMYILANVQARYVQVRLNAYNYLDLDEVQVIQTEKITNNARYSVTSQSSTVGSAISDRAIDANTNGSFSAGSVTQTAVESQPWWQADLRWGQWVGDVKIYPCTDCASGALSDFDIKVSTDLVNWHVIPVNGTPTFPLTVPVNYVVRYVRIQLRGTKSLSLAEVEVNAVPSNVARLMPATQSSTYPGGDAWLAVDDNTDGNFWNGSVSLTKQIDPTTPAWWEINLAGMRAISGVAVYNRTDSNAAGASNYTLTFYDGDSSFDASSKRLIVGTAYHAGAASDLGSYTPFVGFAQSIRMQIPAGTNLNMAEFKVLGSNKSCPLGQTVIDGNACVLLSKWDYSSTPSSLAGRRIAIRVRDVPTAVTRGARWLGAAIGKMTAVDNDLRSRDVFTLVEYRPSGATGNGLPWFALQAQGGDYVYLGADGRLFTGGGTVLDDAWIFTRGASAATGNSLVRIVVTNNFGTTDPFIDNRWKNAPEWYSRITTKPASYSYREKCLSPQWVPSEQRVFWNDGACTSAENNFDYYFVD